MPTSDLQMPLYHVSCDIEVSRERTERPTLRVQLGKQEMVGLGEFRLHTTSHIHGPGDRLDVVGIDAETDAAEMVGLESLGPRADALNPDGAMGSHLASAETDLPVAALSAGCAKPDPTRSLVASVLDAEVSLVYQTFPQRHTDTTYQFRS